MLRHGRFGGLAEGLCPHPAADGSGSTTRDPDCFAEPCPMCLTACYRAWISRLVYAATSHDVATNGFEDLQFYRQWARPNADRTLLREVPDESLREDAASVLRQWAAQLPFEAEPKF